LRREPSENQRRAKNQRAHIVIRKKGAAIHGTFLLRPARRCQMRRYTFYLYIA
jgi:hypothetical protein